MPRVSQNSPLTQSSKDYLIEFLKTKLNRPLDDGQVIYTVEPLFSRLRITASDSNPLGDPGLYSGDGTVSYAKVSLADVLPLPLLYRGAYPTTFRNLRTYLNAEYGIVLEQSELALGNSATPLGDDSAIDIAPNAADGTIALTALTTAGRWTPGSQMHILIESNSLPVRLNSRISLGRPLSLNSLTYSGTPLAF